MTTDLFARHALIASDWAENVRFSVDETGSITHLERGAVADSATILDGPVVPGMPNVHSHAFQRAMAGLTERAGPDGDDFWTWRQLMYDFQAQLDPGDISAITAQLYIELLKHGYTAVGEFHYLHNQPDGNAYDEPAELSLAVVGAAVDVGIAITHLPVLYAYAGFGDQPLTAAQRRFAGDVESTLAIPDRVRRGYAGEPTVTVGVAPHSLRAAAALLGEISRGVDATMPIHIHIAEQLREVEDCIVWCGRRPVEWLLDTVDVDRRWCLIHATHLNDSEIRGIAKSGAVVGLCPTTEANLGDGVFRLPDYVAAGGRWGVGADSNVSVSPVEELRWLEYGQRLIHHRRNVFSSLDGPNVGGALWRAAAAAGAQALGQPVGTLAVGRRADLLVLDDTSVNLAGRSGDDLLSAMIFAGNRNCVRDVYVAGRQVVARGHHAGEETAEKAFTAVIRKLLG